VSRTLIFFFVAWALVYMLRKVFRGKFGVMPGPRGSTPKLFKEKVDAVLSGFLLVFFYLFCALVALVLLLYSVDYLRERATT
jgi:hypothetical protein